MRQPSERACRSAEAGRVRFRDRNSNGGGLQGHECRLDIDGDDITDAELADYIVNDLRLLMVARVRILRKRVVVEAHKRAD